MIAFMIGILVTVLILVVVAAVVPGFMIPHVGDALFAAVIMSLIGLVAGYVFPSLPLPKLFWVAIAWQFVVNTVSLVLASVFVTGIRLSGVVPAIVAGLLFTAIGTVAQLALAPALAELQ